MAEKDFKIKHGLYVADSINASNLTIRNDVIVQGAITIEGGGSISGIYSGFDSDFSAKSTTDLSEGTNQYFTTARARSSVDVTDAGGDGSLSYDSSTGTFTYTGPSASEARAHFTGGTGVTITDGSIAIGQSVGTTDNVTFAKITGDSAALDNIKFTSRATAPSNTFGTFYYDSDEQKGPSITLRTLENTAPGVTLNVGQEILLYVHNLTGAQVNKGEAVYISGTAHGMHPQISLAKSDASGTANPTGVATMDIPDNAHGYVTRYGMVRDLNTSEFTAGDVLYLSKDSAGQLTNTAVTTETGYPVHVARVMAVDSTEGMILIDPLAEHFEYLRIQDELRVTGKIIGDSAELAQIDFDTGYAEHISYKEGALWYDNIHKTLNFWGDDSGVVHEIGIEEHQRVYNNTGSTITKGKPLYFSGNYAPGGGILAVPTVGLADATDVNAYNAQGLAAGDIPNNSYGYCIISGQIDGLDTSHLNAGTNFFVGLGPGLTQNASPLYPNFPMCLGWVVNSDSNDGVVLINQQNHSVNSFRVRTSAHIGTDLQVDGNLTVLGTQTTVGQSNVTQGAPFYRLNEGDAIGEAGTTFVGSGLDDAFFAGHFTGPTPQSYYVRIDGVGTGAGGVDTFEVALGSDSTFQSPILTKQNITGDAQLIHSTDNISVEFSATTGHDSGDVWKGTASPVNVDTGFFTNRNTGTSGVGYTHMGFYFDVSDEKWKVIDEYDSTPTGIINVTDSALGILVADTFEGSFTGDVTGNASTATALANARDFSLTGDITAAAVSFDGTGNIQLTTAYNPGSIVNADINASAAIADTKLANISTAGKVLNSATTATAANTASAIVARDASGNFSAGTITADFDRSANTTVTSGTYGSASLVPVLTVDASGFIDSIGTVSVAGVSSTSFDSSAGALTINTADGGSFVQPVYTRELTRTAISGSTGISYNNSTGVLTTNDAQIVHDNLSGFVANEHIDHSSVSITAGSGLTGGGDITATRTLNIGAGTGITVNANDIQVDEANVNHDNLSGFVANEHINHTSVSILAGTGLDGGGDISSSRTINISNTGVTAATYGSASQVPVFTVNAQGQLDSAGTVSVAGVSSTSFDSATGTYIINTADGGSYPRRVYSRELTRTAVSAGTGISYNSSTGVISSNDGAIVHDNLSGFVANEHINHTSVSITAGSGLTGGGDISATRTLNIGAGTGITVNADDIQVDEANVNHDNLSGFVANEHIDHSSVSVTAGTGLTGGGDITATRTINVIGGKGIIANANDIQIDSANIRGMFSGSNGVNYNSSTGAFDVDEANVLHDNLSGFVANEHINHTSVTFTAGTGLTGGGDISSSRTFNVIGGKGIIANANDIQIDSANISTIISADVDKAFVDALNVDADTLDGQNGTYYRIDVYDASGTLLN